MNNKLINEINKLLPERIKCVNENVKDRINKEHEFFIQNELCDFLLNAKEKITKELEKGTLLIPALSGGDSLILYILGMSNVNPLDFDLPFEVFKNSFKSKGQFKLVYLTSNPSSFTYSFKCGGSLLMSSSPVLRLAKQVGLTNNDITYITNLDELTLNVMGVITGEKPFKKNYICTHNFFPGTSCLSHAWVEENNSAKPIKCFLDLVNINSMIHSSGVRNASDDYSLNICTREDMYSYLINLGVDEKEALKTTLLKDKSVNNVPEDFKKFINSIGYIFYKAGSIALLKVELLLGDICINNPTRYYKAFFKLFDIGVDPRDVDLDSLLEKVIKHPDTYIETFVDALLDCYERNVSFEEILL